LNGCPYILRSTDNLLVAASDLAQMKKGKITLGLPPVIGASFFPEIIAQFHRLYPNIKIGVANRLSYSVKGLLYMIGYGMRASAKASSPTLSTKAGSGTLSGRWWRLISESLSCRKRYAISSIRPRSRSFKRLNRTFIGI
jgi:hypothetical protein